MACRSRLFSLPSNVFSDHGVLYTYSTSRWSQNGTRTSRPTAIDARSLRSSSIRTNRVRCRWQIVRIRASGADSPSRWSTEATAVASAQRDSIDVIILDLHLKQGTGFGVMRALATAHLKPRIIVLTNYDLPEYKNAALALGATHFLDKARDYGRLPEVLHEICETHLSKH